MNGSDLCGYALWGLRCVAAVMALWWRRRHLQAMDTHLADAADLAGLESRLRAWERNEGHRAMP